MNNNADIQQARIDEYVARVVADAPPLTRRQQDAIRTILAPSKEQMAERMEALKPKRSEREMRIERLASRATDHE
jgi:hypothetical protein